MNDPDLPPRKQQVSESQLMAMLDFLREHPDLAKGLTRGRLGKVHANIWNQCAKKLNVYKCGVSKDGKGWSRYWCDWKYRTRRRALELRAAKEANRPPPEGSSQLNFLEEKILEIIGENSVNNVVIKTDPLADQDFEEDDVDNNSDDVSTSAEPHYSSYGKKSLSSRCKSKAKRRCVSRTSRASRSSRRYSADEPDADDDVKPLAVPSCSKGATREEEIALEMVQIEKDRLKLNHKQLGTLQVIANEVSRIADVMTDIRESLINVNTLTP